MNIFCYLTPIPSPPVWQIWALKERIFRKNIFFQKCTNLIFSERSWLANYRTEIIFKIGQGKLVLWRLECTGSIRKKGPNPHRVIFGRPRKVRADREFGLTYIVDLLFLNPAVPNMAGRTHWRGPEWGSNLGTPPFWPLNANLYQAIFERYRTVRADTGLGLTYIVELLFLNPAVPHMAGRTHWRAQNEA